MRVSIHALRESYYCLIPCPRPNVLSSQVTYSETACHSTSRRHDTAHRATRHRRRLLASNTYTSLSYTLHLSTRLSRAVNVIHSARPAYSKHALCLKRNREATPAAVPWRWRRTCAHQCLRIIAPSGVIRPGNNSLHKM